MPHCSYGTCNSDSRRGLPGFSSEVKFYRFPQPCLFLRNNILNWSKNEENVHVRRCKKCSICRNWMIRCKRNDHKFQMVRQISNNLYVCSKHFEDQPAVMNYEKYLPSAKQPNPEADRSYEQDIEMVELSSDDEQEIDVIVSRIIEDSTPSPALTSAAALAATSALHLPVKGRPPKTTGRRGRRKNSAVERSPTKSMTLMDSSVEGSMDSSRCNSDEELEDEEISLIPLEELEFIDLQDPLELAYTTWKNMNDVSRRATIRAYLSRLASFLPPRFPRNNKPNIMESAIRFLDEVTKENAILAIEQEILMQRHYVLRKKRAKLDVLIKKKKKQK